MNKFREILLSCKVDLINPNECCSKDMLEICLNQAESEIKQELARVIESVCADNCHISGDNREGCEDCLVYFIKEKLGIGGVKMNKEEILQEFSRRFLKKTGDLKSGFYNDVNSYSVVEWLSSILDQYEPKLNEEKVYNLIIENTHDKYEPMEGITCFTSSQDGQIDYKKLAKAICENEKELREE